MASEPERIIRRATPSFRTVFEYPSPTPFEDPNHAHDAIDTIKTLDQALESEYEGPLSPSERQPPQPAPCSVPDLLGSQDFRAVICLMAQEKAERIYANRMSESLYMAAEEALSDAFQTGLDSANEGLKTSSYHFMEAVFIELMQKVSLDELFNRNIDRWTQSTTFMDAFVARALALPRLVRPVASFIRKNMRAESEKKITETKAPDLPYSLWNHSPLHHPRRVRLHRHWKTKIAIKRNANATKQSNKPSKRRKHAKSAASIGRVIHCLPAP